MNAPLSYGVDAPRGSTRRALVNADPVCVMPCSGCLFERDLGLDRTRGLNLLRLGLDEQGSDRSADQLEPDQHVEGDLEPMRQCRAAERGHSMTAGVVTA